MSFKDKSEIAAWNICDRPADCWEDFDVWTLEQIINTLWADEHTKKMKVRQMLADMRGEI